LEQGKEKICCALAGRISSETLWRDKDAHRYCAKGVQTCEDAGNGDMRNASGTCQGRGGAMTLD